MLSQFQITFINNISYKTCYKLFKLFKLINYLNNKLSGCFLDKNQLKNSITQNINLLILHLVTLLLLFNQLHNQ